MDKSAKNIWKSCLDLIQEQVSPQTFKTWFEPIQPVKFENNVLTIRVASSYVYEYLEERFIGLLSSVLKDVIGPQAKLAYSVVIGNKPRHAETTTIASTSAIKPEKNTIHIGQKYAGLKNPFQKETNYIQVDSQLNPLYTMDSFIVGECNHLAKSVGMSIAENPGRSAYNPLLIYGNSGLGKTHLAQAIGLEVKRNDQDKNVLYISTHLFQAQFTAATLKNEINDFMNFYRLIDVLILDDIHDLAGKTSTQNTFFHIFNHLHQLGKQLILTCDKMPAELSGIEDRLLSRFKWGVSAEITSPDFETRKEIISNKAQKDGIEFSPEIIEYICEHVSTNVRELEGTIISLLAQATFNKKDLTVGLVKEVLGKTVKTKEKELTINKIQQIVCEHFRIAPSELQAKTRKREIVQARYLAMYFCKNYTKSSLSLIGNQIGQKDHTTVLYACKVVSDLIDTDRRFKMHVEELQKKLYL